MPGKRKPQLQNGDVESLSAAPAGSLRVFEIRAQPAGMLKPPVTNQLDARRPQKVSLFLAPDLRSIRIHCALFAVHAQLRHRHRCTARSGASGNLYSGAFAICRNSRCQRTPGWLVMRWERYLPLRP